MQQWEAPRMRLEVCHWILPCMGLPLKAKRTLRWTLLATAVLAAVLLATPDVYGRVIGLGAEISFYLLYPRLQEVEYAA